MRIDAENYDKWYDDFSQYLREGVLTDNDNSEALIRLLRYKSNLTGRNKINIDDHIKKFKDGQEKIYYLVVAPTDDIETNIYLESYKGSDLPILICTSPLDEMIFKNINQYKNHKFVNIENESDEFIEKFKVDNSSSINKIPEEEITPFTLWIKNELEPFVTKVTISKRLKDSPLLVTSALSSQMKTMMAMMNFDNKSDPYAAMKDFTVEINPSHEIVVNLNKLRKEDPIIAGLTVKQLYDTALLQANIPLHNNEFVRRSFTLIKTLLSDRIAHNANQPQPDEPVERIKGEDALKGFKDTVKMKNSDIFEDFKIKKE
jgi:HSP90 family molecular chaperone